MESLNNNPVAHLTAYELRHLAAHLEAAGRIDDLHHLLALETREHRNAWYEAHEHLGDRPGFLADITRAWRLADESLTVHQMPMAMALQYRYALITASVNSLSEIMPPSLLVALIEKGVWTPLQGLAVASQAPKSETKNQALICLIPYLPDEMRHTVLQTMLTEAKADGVSWLHKAETLAAVAAYLAEGERLLVVQEAWDIVKTHTARGSWSVLELLVTLAHYLPEQEQCKALLHALATTRRIGDNYDNYANYARRKALIILGKQAPTLLKSLLDAAYKHLSIIGVNYSLEETRHWVEAHLALARHAHRSEQEWGSAVHRIWTDVQEKFSTTANLAEGLSVLAPYLPEGERRPVVQEIIANRKGEIFSREALIALAPYLPEGERLQVLHEELDRLRRWPLKEKKEHVSYLAMLVPLLPEEERVAVLSEGLKIVQNILPLPQFESDRMDSLAALAPLLPKPLLYEALTIAQEVRDGYQKDKFLTTLLPLLAERPLHELLDVSSEIDITYDGTDEKAKALLTLALSLSEAVRLPLLLQAIQAAREIGNRYERTKVLLEIVAHLPKEEQLSGWSTVLESAVYEPSILVTLVPRLDEMLLPEVLNAALQHRPVDEYAPVLAALAPRLPRSLLYEALKSACQAAIKDNEVRLLAALLPFLPESERLPLVDEALEAVQRLWHWEMERQDKPVGQYVKEALVPLAPHLQTHSLEAIHIAQQIPDPGSKTEATLALIPSLPEEMQLPTLSEALRAVHTIEGDATDRIKVLLRQLPHLSEEGKALVLSASLKAMRGMGTYDAADYRFPYQEEALVNLASYLPQSLFEELLRIVQAWGRDWECGTGLQLLAPYLPGSLLDKAVGIARTLRLNVREETLENLAYYLPDEERVKILHERAIVLREEVEAVLANEDVSEQASFLANILSRPSATLLDDPLGPLHKVLNKISSINDEEKRGNSLIKLIPHLPKEERLPALREVLPIALKDSQHRTNSRNTYMLERRSRN